jgi:hypothetical protein
MLIANTNFVEMDEEDFDVRRDLKEVLLETRMLYDLIMNSWIGVPVAPDKHSQKTSTDESMDFIFCGSSNKQDEFRLITKISRLNKGAHSTTWMKVNTHEQFESQTYLESFWWRLKCTSLHDCNRS